MDGQYDEYHCTVTLADLAGIRFHVRLAIDLKHENQELERNGSVEQRDLSRVYERGHTLCLLSGIIIEVRGKHTLRTLNAFDVEGRAATTIRRTLDTNRLQTVIQNPIVRRRSLMPTQAPLPSITSLRDVAGKTVLTNEVLSGQHNSRDHKGDDDHGEALFGIAW